jgi:3-oxoadipate enol-lactonase
MTLTHDVAGEGPAVVLVHSGICDRRMWDPQWSPLLDAGFQVVRCDLRGFGDSPMADRPYNNAEDVVGLLASLGIARAAVVGSSFGGRVAQEVAARWPDTVTALALLCTASFDHTPGDTLRAFGEREDALIAAGDLEGATELNVTTFVGPEAGDDVRNQVRRMQRHAFEVQLAVDEEFPQTTVDVDVSAIKAPCLTVSGGKDHQDFQDIAVDLAKRIPGARHVHLPWAGHLPSMERPAEVTALLTDFLTETAR